MSSTSDKKIVFKFIKMKIFNVVIMTNTIDGFDKHRRNRNLGCFLFYLTYKDL